MSRSENTEWFQILPYYNRNIMQQRNLKTVQKYAIQSVF